MNSSDAKLRIAVFHVLILIAFAVLSIRLWQLQIIHTESYCVQADANRFRLVSIEAPRGVIYDRQGRLLVRNIPSYTVSIVPAALPKDDSLRRAILTRLSQLLQMPLSSKVASLGGAGAQPGIEEILEQNALTPYAPVPIKTDVDKHIAFLIQEDLFLSGAVVEVRPRRQYPSGTLTSQVVGYVGHIPAERLHDYLQQVDEDYTINDFVGLMGVEAAYEKELRGRKGLKHIEVDAFEREVKVLAIDPPQPGYSLVLTLDLDLQQIAEAALREGMRLVKSTAGVVIAMNPQTGEVLAMVSLPSYDNNLFARGISAQEYNELSADPEHPLVNHAISGLYPPGSTFKLIPAAAALEEKVVGRETKLSCKGKLLLPNKYFPDDPEKAQVFKCWYELGHGALNVINALAYSCDIYFYQVGGGFESFSGLGMEKLEKYARAFGFGEPTGIALPGESAGLIPNERWKRANYGEPWVTGDTYNAVIGQGYLLVTPLQLLNATAAVANGGILYRPQVVKHIMDTEGHIIQSFAPEIIRRIPVSTESLNIVREGMRAAVTYGTAHRANLAEIAVAGKTGTAEYPGPRDAEGNLPTLAWFTAFAPYEEPEIALVVLLCGGQGAKVAVPVATQILRAYFALPLPTGEDLTGAPPGD